MASGDCKEILVRYTAENKKAEAGKVFTASTLVKTQAGTNAFDIMQQGEKQNPDLKFEYKMYPDLGAMITAINGVEADDSKKLFWAFMKRDPSGKLCLHDVGVSTYEPADKEEMYFSFENYDIFNKVPNCVTGKVKGTC